MFFSRRFREVQVGEFTVVFWGGLVVGLGGFDFFGEVAEVVGFVTGGYLGGPFLESLVVNTYFSQIGQKNVFFIGLSY